MDYLNIKVLEEQIENNANYAGMIELMKEEVESFCSTFKDDPSKISRWGHHYFCKNDGSLLDFDLEKPTEHKCPVCGAEYNNDLLNGVWVYMYRNNAILAAWKSALLYKVTEEAVYLENVKTIIGFYSDNYLKFTLHNKEGHEFDTLEEMEWGCGRILPQGLNESILINRMINALELVKEDIGKDFLDDVYNNLFKEAFKMLKPQVVKIHNISCWTNTAIGTMGLFFNDKEMIDFVFEGEFNIREQLIHGVTEDGFWYEGSIHYNFFTLEGVTNLLLFAELYDFDFGKEKSIIENMFKQAYVYAFDNHQLPNPNDGWPNINLKTYSYIYSVAAKIFGMDSEVGNLLKNILKHDSERGQLPLSKPYYYKNTISLERLILVPEIKAEDAKEIKAGSTNFEKSCLAIIKKDDINVFYKYGHNGPSHAHPDKMSIEVTIGENTLSRDLSNSGYGNKYCNEWHRVSASHNTVVVNGENHTSTEPGQCIEFTETSIEGKADEVYEGVSFNRKIDLVGKGFDDVFKVTASKESTFDYFFHAEGELLTKLVLKEAELGYAENGYQHLSDIKEVIVDQNEIDLSWKLGEYTVVSTISLENATLYTATSLDNPITNTRTTFILRSQGESAQYNVKWRF